MEPTVKSASSSREDQKKVKVRHKLKAIFSLGVKTKKSAQPLKIEENLTVESENVITGTITENKSPKMPLKQVSSNRPTVSAWGSEEKNDSNDDISDVEPERKNDQVDTDKNEDRSRDNHGKSKFSQLWKNISRRNIDKLRQQSLAEEAETVRNGEVRESKGEVRSFKMGVDSVSSSDGELSDLVNLNRVASADETGSLPELEDDDDDDGDTISATTPREVQSDMESPADAMTMCSRLHPAISRSRSTSQLSSFDDSFSQSINLSQSKPNISNQDSSNIHKMPSILAQNSIDMFAAKSYPALNKPKTIGQRFRSVFTLKKATKRLESATEGIAKNPKEVGKSDDTVSIKSVLKSKKRGIFSRSKAVETGHLDSTCGKAANDPSMFDSSLDLRLAIATPQESDSFSDEESSYTDTLITEKETDHARRTHADFLTTPNINRGESKTQSPFMHNLDVDKREPMSVDINMSVIKKVEDSNMYDSDSMSNITNISSEEEKPCEFSKVKENDISDELSSDESDIGATDNSIVESPTAQNLSKVSVPASLVGDDKVVEAIPVGSKSRRGSLTNSVRNLAMKSGKLKKAILVTRIANMFSKKRTSVLNQKNEEHEKNADEVEVSSTRPTPLLPRSAVVENYTEPIKINDNTNTPSIDCTIKETTIELESNEQSETPNVTCKYISDSNSCSNCKRLSKELIQAENKANKIDRYNNSNELHGKGEDDIISVLLLIVNIGSLSNIC